MNSISVIVPVYNSENTLAELCRRLTVVLKKISSMYEIILVDDSSKDRSWVQITSLAKQDRCIRGFQMSQNFGQHNALLFGTRQARHDVIVTIDDDLQNPPEEIPKLLAALDTENDVVYGTPAHQQHGLLRDLASQMNRLVLKGAMGNETVGKISAFRAFRAWLRDAFKDYHSSFISIDVLLTWGTSRFTSVQVAHEPRKSGTSQYTIWKLIRHALNMLTGFSTLPLQIASVIGFIFTFFGLGILVFVIGRYLIFGSVVPGFAFLACIIAIFAGAQLFALGMLGEYIARIHFRTLNKPAYHVRTSTHEHSI